METILESYESLGTKTSVSKGGMDRIMAGITWRDRKRAQLKKKSGQG